MESGKITWFGPERDAPSGKNDETIDAGGGTVVPGLIDCHTHVVFAGSREDEYVRKIRGESYLQIMQAGGGIRSTMRAVRVATEDELIAQSLPRLRRMLAGGTTTIEIKSGYGLRQADELKMLRVIARLRQLVPMEIVATYLGAHAVPPEFDWRADDYIDAMTEPSLLQTIAREKLADFADAFCEQGAFTVEQARRFLSRCAAHGLRPKVHAEQLSNYGGTRLAAELNAASADHLECIHDEDIAALQATLARREPGVPPRGAPTIPVLLPGCSFFLGTPPADARRLIDAGLPVALATDCNPGSSMIESLPLIMSIAAGQLRMTPAESLVACTANAAAALGRADRLGAIHPGHQADLLILDVPALEQWAYRVGVNAVSHVIKEGCAMTSSL
jgi:imidazolonepropionase